MTVRRPARRTFGDAVGGVAGSWCLGEAMDPVVLPEATGGNGAISTYGLTSDPVGPCGPRLRRVVAAAVGDAGDGGEPTTSRTRCGRLGREPGGFGRGDPDVPGDGGRRAHGPGAGEADGTSTRWRRWRRRTLTSALENIGSRLAQSVPTSGLTLAGQSVPLGASGSDRTRTCFSGSPGFSGSSGSPATSECGPQRSPGAPSTTTARRPDGVGGSRGMNSSAQARFPWRWGPPPPHPAYPVRVPRRQGDPRTCCGRPGAEGTSGPSRAARTGCATRGN